MGRAVEKKREGGAKRVMEVGRRTKREDVGQKERTKGEEGHDKE